VYTEEDLNLAVDKGIFTKASVEEFRRFISLSRSSPSADEENFKLIGGFNDIFVVLACSLFLLSSLWVAKSISYYCHLFNCCSFSLGIKRILY
jgi:hypothetical protein